MKQASIKYETIRCPQCKKLQMAMVKLRLGLYEQRVKKCNNCEHLITGGDWITVNDL
jgi:ribosomal protein L37AE/L43A